MKFYLLLIAIFFIGILENLLSSFDIKMLQKNRKIICAIMAYINIIIYFRIFQAMMENINNRIFEQTYAIGFAVGAYLTIKLDNYLDRIAHSKGFKKFKKKLLVKMGIKKK